MGSENVWMSGLHDDMGAEESSVTSEVLEKDLVRKALRYGPNQKYFPRRRWGTKKNEVSVEKRDMWIQL